MSQWLTVVLQELQKNGETHPKQKKLNKNNMKYESMLLYCGI